MSASLRRNAVQYVLGGFLVATVGSAWGEAPQPPASLCLNAQDGCYVVGSIVRFTVDVGASDSFIVAGQFSIDYDPETLELLDISPGYECAPTSPFAVKLGQVVDEEDGTAFYAVRVPIGHGGTQGPETLACVSFLVLAEPEEPICLFDADSPYATLLSNEIGQSVPIDNSLDCPPGVPLPTLSCDDFDLSSTCTCPTSTPDCSAFDSQCSEGVCYDYPARCEALPINEGEECDDGDWCTVVDVCIDGKCVGSGCPLPSLCVVPELGCYALGGTTVRLELGEGEPAIIAGQFSIQYDPEVLDFVGISPGRNCNPDSPFALEIYEDVDETVGDIFYAVGINPFANRAGVYGPTTMACLNFATNGTLESEVCLYSDEHPRHAVFSDRFGHPVRIYNAESCGVGLEPPLLSCELVEVDEDCVCVPGTGDCKGLDTDCRMGLCDEVTQKCYTVPVNEGGPCDDGEPCTVVDVCIDGECVGSGCTQPSLCVVAEQEQLVPGMTGDLTIELSNGTHAIVGAQFSIQYDPEDYDFVEILPGSACDPESPFSLEIYSLLNEAEGDLFYAVGVPPGETPAAGPATVACLKFVLLSPSSSEICLYAGTNPYNTLLADENEHSVEIYNDEDCPPDHPLPILSCDSFDVPVPAVGGWGLVMIALLLLVAGKVYFGNRRSASRV